MKAVFFLAVVACVALFVSAGDSCGDECSCDPGTYCQQCNNTRTCPVCWHNSDRGTCGDCCSVKCTSNDDCKCNDSPICNNVTGTCDSRSQLCGRKCGHDDDCDTHIDNGCCTRCHHKSKVCVNRPVTEP
eukprot:NODE_1345_length_996_cov_217.532207_g1036_i0.p2 GENE.NODE_1345_length_996_cov_217.532207_g1036_i0~~NODE_1345_length_996_cov_217.532207_g1036_i0.p2  ORF type:complete len:130 (+),score=18.88 NODE_1345_length_996_cov_217.532207_g1036_i0:547-936(+)